MNISALTIVVALVSSQTSLHESASLQAAPLLASSLAAPSSDEKCVLGSAEGQSSVQTSKVCAERSGPPECENGEAVYVDSYGVERPCNTGDRSLQKQSGGLGDFGYVGIALVITGGVAAIALGGGSPASP